MRIKFLVPMAVVLSGLFGCNKFNIGSCYHTAISDTPIKILGIEENECIVMFLKDCKVDGVKTFFKNEIHKYSISCEKLELANFGDNLKTKIECP